MTEPRFYVATLDGYPINAKASGYSAGTYRGGQESTEFLVIDRHYCHEAVWASGLQNRQYRERYRRFAETFARELNEYGGEWGPESRRIFEEMARAREKNAASRLYGRLVRRRERRARDAEAERRLGG